MELYLAACQPDPHLLPFATMGPTLSPPIKDYIQDGEYKDVTRQYKVPTYAQIFGRAKEDKSLNEKCRSNFGFA